MTDRAAFIAAICAAPDDDLPRLVFSDWLEENGEPERAEFIRVQIKLSRLICSPFCRDGCVCEVGDLRRRERELLEIDWIDQDGMPKFGGSTFSYRRGFIESITCSWSNWQRHADAIRAATPLKRVKLTTWPDSTIDGKRPTVGDYPGITFELPQPTYIERDFRDLLITGNLLPDDPRTISAVGP